MSGGHGKEAQRRGQKEIELGARGFVAIAIAIAIVVVVLVADPD